MFYFILYTHLQKQYSVLHFGMKKIVATYATEQGEGEHYLEHEELGSSGKSVDKQTLSLSEDHTVIPPFPYPHSHTL